MRRRWLVVIVVLVLSLPVCAQWGNPNGSCFGSEETSDTSLSCTTGTTTNGFAAGSVVGMWVATDNVDTADGQTSLHSAMTDSDGNTYTKWCEYTNGQGAAAAGATVSFWTSSVLTASLESPDTITLTTASAVADKVMNAEEFTIGSGHVVSREGSCQTLSNDNSDPGSLSISGLTNGEYLFVRAIASESNLINVLTPTTSYTVVGSDGCAITTGGSEASDMGECGEFRILSAAGDTSDPTLDDTTNDNASVYMALKEAPPPEAPQVMPRRVVVLH